MKKSLFIILLLIAYSCQSGSRPNVKDVLDSELPNVWREVTNIYLWEGEKLTEYEIRKAPISKDACLSLGISEEEAPLCSFLFDSEGNQTPYFLALEKSAIGVDSVTFETRNIVDNIEKEQLTISVNDMMQDMLGILCTSLYVERIDEKGKYTITVLGGISARGGGKFIFRLLNKEKSFQNEMIIEKEYLLNFNKDRTSVFLNIIPDIEEKQSKKESFDIEKLIKDQSLYEE